MEIANVLIEVDGKSFRCDCGCNVFHHPELKPEIYECNACGARYKGTKNAARVQDAGREP